MRKSLCQIPDDAPDACILIDTLVRAFTDYATAVLRDPRKVLVDVPAIIVTGETQPVLLPSPPSNTSTPSRWIINYSRPGIMEPYSPAFASLQ